MEIKDLVELWFDIWTQGNLQELPISDDFIHTSPYGIIEGKETYLNIVQANKDKFLNHKFEIHDILCEGEKACVRYTTIQEDFRLEVSEWHYTRDGLIQQIVAYYNIPGEIREDRKLDM